MLSTWVVPVILWTAELIHSSETHPDRRTRPKAPSRYEPFTNSDCNRHLVDLNKTTFFLQTQVDDLKIKNTDLVSQISILKTKCTCLSECEYRGKTYFDGDSWNPDPCTSCTCQDSKVHCSLLDTSTGCGFQCSESSCLNGGFCHPGPTADTFACECPLGFTGPLCEYSVSRCVPHKKNGSCSHEKLSWIFDPSQNQCTSTSNGCYDRYSLFPSASTCSSACMQGTCCYRSDANSEDMICQEESIVDCQALCHSEEVEVVGFYPGTHCSSENCIVQNHKSCHTGTALHWPGSTFSFGCETCQCLEDRISCKCSKRGARREIRELSSSERQRYQRAIAALQDMGSKSPWSSFRDLYATYIMHSHSPSYFLLWHRLFLHNMERHLQQIDCSVTIPYFDFTLDAGDLSESVVWQDSYFGRKQCYFTSESSEFSPHMQCIERRMASDFPIPTMVEVAIALANANYQDFTAYMQNVAGYLHSFVGGDMETSGSPGDPVFYSIHAYIDLLFWRWQQRHNFLDPDNFPADLQEAVLLPFNTALKHTVDLENSLCVSYEIKSFSRNIKFPATNNEVDAPIARHPYPVDVNQGMHPCSFDQDDSEFECTASHERETLDIGYRVQEVLYAQNEDFLRTLPRSCPSLGDVPDGYLNQVWHEPKLNMKNFTKFQKIHPKSDLENRFCFTADIFVPEERSQSTLCQNDPVAVCDMSVLSSCPFYPHSLCKLSLCGNCSASCYINGQEVQCGDRTKDFCNPNPCKNNAYCVPSVWPAMPHLITCKCQPGYEGQYCELSAKQHCHLPVDHGEMIEDCGAENQRWYFNPQTQDCQPFWFNGCFGNANNFPSYYDCRISCIIGACCWRSPVFPNDLYGFSEEGYDRYGFDAKGFSPNNKKRTLSDGFGGDRAIYRNSGFDYQGYNQKGLNEHGFDRFGYDYRGYHHVTRFNRTGYDSFGDHDGIIDFDEYGYDSDGYNRAGLNCHGHSRDGWDYHSLRTGWKFECRAMNLRDCQKTESEFLHLHQEVISFSPGKKCEEVHCGQLCGCDFLGHSYTFKSQIPLGCGTCECQLDGRIHCPCTTVNIRKEIRDLTSEELRRFQKALKSLNSGEHSVWSNLTQMYQSHIPQSRGGPHFLPWHRFYLRLVEMKLQEVDCAITIPYFDWTMDSGDLKASVVWQANFFGGDGDSEVGNCVQHPFKSYYPENVTPCLRRQFDTSVQVPDAIAMEVILRETSYDTFRLQVEAVSSLFHLFVGGHMSSSACAYDPIFLLHYAFLDKLWYEWEHFNPHGNTHYPSELRYIPMVPFGIAPDDVLLSEVQICVMYADITEGAPCHLPPEGGIMSRDMLESEDYLSPSIYDVNGFNAEGYHSSGFDKMGWTRKGFYRDSFNRDGFDINGFDHSGFNRYGFNSNGCNLEEVCSGDPTSEPSLVSTDSERFNTFGYNAIGLDYHGYDAYGFNTQGYDKNNCSYFFKGPFYPLFMKKAKEQFKQLSDKELETIERICIPMSVLPDWWMTISWLNRNGQESTVRRYEKEVAGHHLDDDQTISTELSFYDGWLPPTADDRFCFHLHHHSGCNLNEPPVPCPLQNCDNPICSSQPTARCRQFGCGSCDMTYFDLASKQLMTCNSLDCISMEGSNHKEGEVWKEDLCETCTCQQGHVTCSVMDCENTMSCQHPIRMPDVCCPVCEGCEFEGGSYANHAGFIHPRNPCLQCMCMNGTVHCTHTQCPPMPPCEKQALVTLPGECCPICSMCGPHSNGSSWMESPCHNCTCKDGQVQCSVIECLPLHCKYPWRPPGQCCRSCDGCEYEGLVQKTGENFKPDPCNECQCKDGEVACRRTQCSTPNCFHPVTKRGECCPVCPKECEYEGQMYNHGENFAPEFNACLNCSCQDSLVRCHTAVCLPLEPPCRNPVVPPGKCCPVCPNCTADDRHYTNGARWRDLKSPCSTCICMDGLIICSKKDTCDEECTHGVILDGECCSPCKDCIYEGHLVMDRMQFSPPDDPCSRCTCMKGSITCSREACPQLLCRKTEQPPGSCCPICKGCVDGKGVSIPHGHQWVHPSDLCQMCMCNEGISRCERKMCDVRCTHPVKRPDRCCADCQRCQYEGKIYQNRGEVPSKDPCKRCICYAGNVECESVTCPPVTCERPAYVPGQCCPKCSECRLHGNTYKHGEVFHPPADPCYNCSCEMGVLHCRKIEEFCNAQCSHPIKINGQCCPVCDGCQYQRNSYQNGEKFKSNPDDPCQECECVNGNVICKVHQCTQLPCPNPIKSEGECCGHCSQFCTDDTEGKETVHYEGEVWHHPKDSCQVCMCKHSVVRCERKTCPPVDCPHPASPFDECCPTCEHCEFSRRLYRNGQEFPHVDDPCQMCTCQNGTVSCNTLICDPLPCANPTPVEGHCCPVCLPNSGCNYLDNFYEPWEKFVDPEHPCMECMCADGAINCHKDLCPQANCPNPVYSHCCDNCDGCSYGERNYMNHNLFPDPYNPCRQCQCDNGVVSCQQQACPPVMCNNPVMMENECCPVCRECFYLNKLYQNGEKFLDPSNPCLECDCQYPLVHCQPRTCQNINCTNPVDDSCCKKCSDCMFENQVYEDGTTFTHPKGPCTSCTCQKGNIHCREKSCPSVTCSHPVPGDCCDECRADCWLDGARYTHWQVFPHPQDPCKECVCRKGNITCKAKKCLPVKCSFPSENQCCPSCTDCYYKGKLISNGKTMDSDGSDKCSSCRCQNGNIKCQPRLCPVVHCSNPVMEGCCPVCHLGCLYSGQVYNFGAEFDHPTDPCSECACMDGSVHCDLKPCDPVSCSNPIKLDGQCCPECPTYCFYNGTKRLNGAIFSQTDDPCNECRCSDGNLQCYKKHCPLVNCTYPAPGICCIECKDCQYLGKVYLNGETFPNSEEQCETCTCKKGEVRCKRSPCPTLTCPVQRVLDGQCCPVCITSCKVGNQIYEDGDTFTPGNEKCQKCTCLEGQVVCKTETCANCSHPIPNPGQCCPSCDGCLYDGSKYSNQERFTLAGDPCEECICKNGSVTCHHLACSLPSCAHPVLPKGQCCPVCQGCSVSGIKFEEGKVFTNPENPCEECLCVNGNAVCKAHPCQWNCTNPIPDPCCPICDGCLFEGNSYTNGQKFYPDPCRTCICRDGTVSCVSETCPELKCQLRTRIPDQCCEVCRGCVYEGTEYENGANWVSSSNPCLSCQCVGGTITCSELHCLVPCAKPRPVPGRCCPICPECVLDGKVYKSGDVFTPDDSPCDTCTCDSGELVCISRQCPALGDCPRDAIKPPGPGECCPTCAGFSSTCTKEQIGHLVQPTADPCLVCQCAADFSWVCSREICPSLYCPEKEVIQEKGVCCPKCKVCASEIGNEMRQHGSSWPSESDPCVICTCEFGVVQCTEFTCLEIKCNIGEIIHHPPGECCDVCLPFDHLSCRYGELYYTNGQVWNPEPCILCHCSSGKTTCQSQRCIPLSCPSDEIPSVDPGQCCPKCIPRPATCVAFGDPHYRTFDGAIIHFQGTCRYILAADCFSQHFSVIVENNDRGFRGVSWTERVVLVLPNTTVDLRKGPTVFVKGKLVKNLPFFDKPVLYIENTGSSVLVTTDAGVKVLWNGDSYVEVIVSGVYRSKTCGLCGNFNNYPQDDMRLPTGQIVTSGARFGNSWKNRGAQPAKCTEAVDLDPCAARGYRARRIANSKCSVLKGMLFAPCHPLIPPEPYFASCVYDVCACSENDDCLCDILSAYSQECAKAGVVLSWRSSGFCDLECPEEEGLVFDECGPPCPRTCENKDVPIGILAAQCFKPCVPGCQCSADKVLHNGRCISMKNCP